MKVNRRDVLGMIAASFVPPPGSRFAIADSRGKAPPAANDLNNAIPSLIRNAGAADVAVAFHDLASGEELLIQPDVNIHPASTIKVPIMMEVFRQAEEKTLVLDDRIAVSRCRLPTIPRRAFTIGWAND
jgi:beta-lactamase class A